LNWAKSQLDGYSVNPEHFDCSTIIKENVNLISSQAEEKEISIINRVEVENYVYADVNMIGLVVLNLLSNAVKFTKNGGEIVIWSDEKESKTEFHIQDNGIGISGKELTKLLEETNFRTTDGTNNEKGTGLGLMLCKDFIHKNNGKISAQSEVGKGSTFTFTLPKNEESFNEAAPSDK
jgi:signal transduction histidine kinase